MRKAVLWLGVTGFLGVSAAAGAQAPTSAFDGTYSLVSATKLTPTYVTRGGQMGICQDRSPGPLTISQGRAWYTTSTGYQLVGNVGPQGQLAMGIQAPPNNPGSFRPIEMRVNGQVQPSGYARVRQTGNSCSYDFLWLKQAS